MKDYFKDFEFFGFDSELQMAKEIIDWAYKNPENGKSMEEIVDDWIDNHSEEFGAKKGKSKLSN
jgi:ABC-type proline/glycine betaine transport system substrate-binding protein